MSTSEITVQEQPAQPAAVVRTEVSAEELPAFLGGAFGELIGALIDVPEADTFPERMPAPGSSICGRVTEEHASGGTGPP